MVAPPAGPVATVISPWTSSDFNASRAVPLLTPNSACSSVSFGSLSPGSRRRSAIQRLISSTTRSPRLEVRMVGTDISPIYDKYERQPDLAPELLHASVEGGSRSRASLEKSRARRKAAAAQHP